MHISMGQNFAFRLQRYRLCWGTGVSLDLLPSSYPKLLHFMIEQLDLLAGGGAAEYQDQILKIFVAYTFKSVNALKSTNFTDILEYNFMPFLIIGWINGLSRSKRNYLKSLRVPQTSFHR